VYLSPITVRICCNASLSATSFLSVETRNQLKCAGGLCSLLVARRLQVVAARVDQETVQWDGKCGRRPWRRARCCFRDWAVRSSAWADPRARALLCSAQGNKPGAVREIKYPSGNVYVGGVLNGKRHGHGA
jgi:hypothetical protein